MFILMGTFTATVAYLCRRNPAIGPPATASSWKERLKALTGIIEALMLFMLAIGGLFGGLFSPTQAGAIGAGGALLIDFDPIWFGVITVLVTNDHISYYYNELDDLHFSLDMRRRSSSRTSRRNSLPTFDLGSISRNSI